MLIEQCAVAEIKSNNPTRNEILMCEFSNFQPVGPEQICSSQIEKGVRLTEIVC